MAVFTDLDLRVSNPPFDTTEYNRRLSGCQLVAKRMPLVHVSGRERAFKVTVLEPPHEIPTSDDHSYCTDYTRHAEKLLGLQPSAYFYAGRAHPGFGVVAMAFAPHCEADHTGTVTPFDTGGLVHPERFIKIRLTDPGSEAELVAYGQASQLLLDRWREVFAQILAAYFLTDAEYWTGRPRSLDLEGLYELNRDWRAWTFEVRFHEGQSIHQREAWCADEPTMESLRRLLDAQHTTPPGDPPTPLERFLQGPRSLAPAGTPEFCERLEQWVREQVMS
ncbi:hypothetical protein [Singulisphaera acidiphila]|uniref:Uncharacterized protein n=1 Tax=Singulisphaera acidiphila (strain ATCC BAA-1392 / DSM 18658 / VKM B-2454 / MOB10) TaxID=886293 RepID=L0D5E1_SINAD|nr:hypothetical protein [Singulisphaera acidiphila]AGA24467.1 hypothetical protein Sinac_0003 [Singulisphaera acidiphila DSM 18658]